MGSEKLTEKELTSLKNKRIKFIKDQLKVLREEHEYNILRTGIIEERYKYEKYLKALAELKAPAPKDPVEVKPPMDK